MKKIPKDVKIEIDKYLSSLLGFVDNKYIITVDETKGLVFIGGERIDEVRLSNLKNESEFILNSELWKVLSETIKFMAYEKMFIKSNTYEDLLSGKMWLYHLDIQKKIMEKFKNVKKSSPIPTYSTR